MNMPPSPDLVTWLMVISILKWILLKSLQYKFKTTTTWLHGSTAENCFTLRSQSGRVLQEANNWKFATASSISLQLLAPHHNLCHLATDSSRSPLYLEALRHSQKHYQQLQIIFFSLKLHLFTLNYKFHININTSYFWKIYFY